MSKNIQLAMEKFSYGEIKIYAELFGLPQLYRREEELEDQAERVSHTSSPKSTKKPPKTHKS